MSRRSSPHHDGEDALGGLLSVVLLLSVGVFVGAGVLLFHTGRLVVRAFVHHPDNLLLLGNVGSAAGLWLLTLAALAASAYQPAWGTAAGVLAGLAGLATLTLALVAVVLERRFTSPPTLSSLPEVPVGHVLRYPWWPASAVSSHEIPPPVEHTGLSGNAARSRSDRRQPVS